MINDITRRVVTANIFITTHVVYSRKDADNALSNSARLQHAQSPTVSNDSVLRDN
jgi:hypothetical protein